MATLLRQPKLTSRRRGAAMVEFALVVPLLVTILLFSMYLAELARVRLKLQEVSRYVAWEMTSYNLTDYANNNHATAFTAARTKAIQEARERYRDLDSVEPNGSLGFFATISDLQIDISDQDAGFIDGSIPVLGPVVGVANNVMGAVVNAWGFNRNGKVKVDVSTSVGSVILNRNFMERSTGGFFNVDQWGGRNLSSLAMQNSFTMIANGWSLPDGGDSTTNKRATGFHPTGSKAGLYTQVNRMTFLGLKNGLENTPGLSAALKVINFAMPISLVGTYVISHGYTAKEQNRDCNNIGEAQSGSRNLHKDVGLDVDTMRCFDTTPFRDRFSWQKSLYVQAFKARGDNYMGCKQAMADDPTTDNSTLSDRYREEKNKQMIACNP